MNGLFCKKKKTNYFDLSFELTCVGKYFYNSIRDHPVILESSHSS